MTSIKLIAYKILKPPQEHADEPVHCVQTYGLLLTLSGPKIWKLIEAKSWTIRRMLKHFPAYFLEKFNIGY
jgi:hypothetical protein